MFMITAYHIFDYAPEINTDLITVTGQDRNTLSFDYDSDYYINKSLDVCIIKMKYKEGFIRPIISSPYEIEKTSMIGFPDVLSNSTGNTAQLQSSEKYGIIGVWKHN